MRKKESLKDSILSYLSGIAVETLAALIMSAVAFLIVALIVGWYN